MLPRSFGGPEVSVDPTEIIDAGREFGWSIGLGVAGIVVVGVTFVRVISGMIRFVMLVGAAALAVVAILFALGVV